MRGMVSLKEGYVGDALPHTVWEIRARIERNAQERFIHLSVPELFYFYELGIEYVSDDKITFEVRN